MKHWLSRTSLASLAVLAGLSGVARAADGDLDPTFGIGGKVTTNFDVPAASATSVALQPDGKIVAAGWLFDKTANVDFAVARYNPNGSPDLTFGSGGKIRTDFFGRDDVANAVAVQGDGKIVVAGSARNDALDLLFALARYNADGSLDTTFDSDGKVTGNFFGLIYAIALQSDGRIVVAGTSYNLATSNDFALSRFHANGSLDTSFGTSGTVQTDFSGLEDSALALIILPGGDFVALGYAATNVTGIDLALARYHSDGSPDSTFGSGGKITTDFGSGDIAYAAALQPSGNVIVAAAVSNPSQPGGALSAVRYSPTGILDQTFGVRGIASSPFAADAGARSMAVQSDGKIVVAGLAQGSDLYDFALTRFDSDGSPDGSFGIDSRVMTDFFGQSDGVGGIVVQPDGKIVAAGGAQDSSTGYFALARYQSTATVPASCPHSDGFWKKHDELWPVDALTLGSQSYSEVGLLRILSSPVRGDASILLARQLIAAKLNIASGSGSLDMAADVASADGLLAAYSGKLPYTVKTSSGPGRAMVRLAGSLASRNNRGSNRGCPAD